MKKRSIIVLLLLNIFFCNNKIHAQADSNWTAQQLMEPADLANIIIHKTDSIIIFSVGPFNTIPNAINVGMASEKEGIEKFKTQLNGIDKNSKVVIYCGCCPFDHCPNVRPAIDVLKKMGFTNYYLLNLSHNLRINWIDKGYPVINQ